MKALEIDPALGVIMVTAVKEEGIAKKAIEHGAFDYITKPIDLDYLRKSVVVKMIQMLGSEDVAQFSSGIKENKKKSFVNKWPPEVLVATDNQMRLAIRNMLRNFGVKAPQFCSSIDEIFSLTKKDSDSEQIIILDNTVPYMLEKISEAKEWLNANQKKILIFSSPTRKDIIEAMHAGISDVLTYPFSQEILEKKLRKLTNTHQANFFDPASSPISAAVNPRRTISGVPIRSPFMSPATAAIGNPMPQARILARRRCFAAACPPP